METHGHPANHYDFHKCQAVINYHSKREPKKKSLRSAKGKIKWVIAPQTTTSYCETHLLNNFISFKTLSTCAENKTLQILTKIVEILIDILRRA